MDETRGRREGRKRGSDHTSQGASNTVPSLPARTCSASTVGTCEGEKCEGEKCEGEKCEGEKCEGERAPNAISLTWF